VIALAGGVFERLKVLHLIKTDFNENLKSFDGANVFLFLLLFSRKSSDYSKFKEYVIN